jgi:hypothetical protein
VRYRLAIFLLDGWKVGGGAFDFGVAHEQLLESWKNSSARVSGKIGDANLDKIAQNII